MPAIRSGCTVLIAARAGTRPPLVSHTFDTAGGVDFRLVRVPPNANPPSPRPVYRWDEEAVPRFFGVGRGPIPQYAECSDGTEVAPPPVLGHIQQVSKPTHGYWEAASGIANDAGLMIAESTCSSIFGAEPRGVNGGQALLGYMELTRLALERCTRAREAVALMGELAVAHGFAGAHFERESTASSCMRTVPSARTASSCMRTVPSARTAILAAASCSRRALVSCAACSGLRRPLHCTQATRRSSAERQRASQWSTARRRGSCTCCPTTRAPRPVRAATTL